jgi:hypothetical protein
MSDCAGIQPHECICNLAFDMSGSAPHALAAVTVMVVVAKFDGFVQAGRSPGRDRGGCRVSVRQRHRDGQGRIAPGIQDFQGLETGDLAVDGHGKFPVRR